MTSRLSHLGRAAMRFAVIVSALAGLAVYVSWAFARVRPSDPTLAARWRPSYRIAFGSSKSSVANAFIYGSGESDDSIDEHAALDPIFAEYARLSVQFSAARADPRINVPTFPSTIFDADFPWARLDPRGLIHDVMMEPQSLVTAEGFGAMSVWSNHSLPEGYLLPPSRAVRVSHPALPSASKKLK